ncbi:MAG: YabP/YqfC family sporulation protein [Clostridia bacterium]|nr:YabP/YqfC family sporulation protein [Clostridia bacterium]
MEQKTVESLALDDRKLLTVSGVEGVISFNESEIKLALLSNTKLTVSGEKLTIAAFDKASGLFKLTGKVNSLRYSDGVNVGIKRFFK